jgi:hypothetical protein
MSDTTAPELKLLASTQRAKLVGMLRNTLQRWPRARLQRSTAGDFGVSLGEGTFARFVFSTDLTIQDKRDLLVLFATWVVVDPDKFRAAIPPAGFSVTVAQESARFSGQHNSQ